MSSHADIAARLNARLGLKKPEPERERTTISHRSTSNSRGPGQEGVVHVRSSGIRRCADCGSVTKQFVPLGRHGVHLQLVDGAFRLVNCAGRGIP